MKFHYKNIYFPLLILAVILFLFPIFSAVAGKPDKPADTADLSITKSDSPDPIIAGGMLTYIITVTNNGPDNAKNVVVSDTLPLALISPSINPSQGNCTAFPCNFPAIPKNNSISITIISPIDSSITGIITNIASVSSDTDDPVTSNNVSTQETAISPLPPSACVPDGSCSASTPTCEQTTTGTDNCNNSCSLTGSACPSEPPPSPASPPSSGGGGTRPTPTTVAFSGRAFPGAKIFIVDKDVRFETTVNQNIVADENGTFRADFTGISEGLHSFGLLIKDKDNRTTQTKFFNIDILANDLVVKDILVPPTAGFSQRLVSRGQPVFIIGNASPNNSVILEIDDTIKKEATVEKDGSYKVIVDTGILEFGTHYVRVKQVDASQKRESDYSPTNAFVVSHLTLPKTDLNGDEIVNIKDWSIFLSNWISKDENQKKIIDLNGDGKVDIADFGVFLLAL